MTLPVWRRLREWLLNEDPITRLEALRIIAPTDEKKKAARVVRFPGSPSLGSTASDTEPIRPLVQARGQR
jgi:hypothetical protein